MGTKRRWLKWVIEEANTLNVVLPWERGANRRLWRKRLSTSKNLLISAKG